MCDEEFDAACNVHNMIVCNTLTGCQLPTEPLSWGTPFVCCSVLVIQYGVGYSQLVFISGGRLRHPQFDNAACCDDRKSTVVQWWCLRQPLLAFQQLISSSHFAFPCEWQALIAVTCSLMNGLSAELISGSCDCRIDGIGFQSVDWSWRLRKDGCTEASIYRCHIILTISLLQTR